MHQNIVLHGCVDRNVVADLEFGVQTTTNNKIMQCCLTFLLDTTSVNSRISLTPQTSPPPPPPHHPPFPSSFPPIFPVLESQRWTRTKRWVLLPQIRSTTDVVNAITATNAYLLFYLHIIYKNDSSYGHCPPSLLSSSSPFSLTTTSRGRKVCAVS